MRLPELLILRHGETKWNVLGRLQGEMDSPLTETGVAQAERQNEILAAIGIQDWDCFASPQGRAQRTAEIALSGQNVAVTSDVRLREIGMGDWTGMLRQEVAGLNPLLFETDGLGWYDHAPGGEGLVGVERRAATFLSELSGPSVIITHGITSRVLRCIAQGLPVEAFETLGGGQGVVYRIFDQKSQLLA